MARAVPDTNGQPALLPQSRLSLRQENKNSIKMYVAWRLHGCFCRLLKAVVAMRHYKRQWQGIWDYQSYNVTNVMALRNFSFAFPFSLSFEECPSQIYFIACALKNAIRAYIRRLCGYQTLSARCEMLINKPCGIERKSTQLCGVFVCLRFKLTFIL